MTTNLMEPSVFQHSIFSPQHRAQNPVASNYLEPHTLNPNLNQKPKPKPNFFSWNIDPTTNVFNLGGVLFSANEHNKNNGFTCRGL